MTRIQLLEGYRSLKKKLVQNGGADKETFLEKQPRNKQKSISIKLLFIYTSLFSLISVLIYYHLLGSSHKVNTVDEIGYSLGFHSNVYAVVIDAGSTGSRVLAFCFYKPTFGGGLKLQNDLFIHNKPGLSSFADDPKKGALKIEELIKEAQKFVPKSEWSKTPIALRATAGLRLLPTEKAEALLNEVRTLIENTGFLSNNESVSIMDGKDEGLFSWFTVNFLLDHLSTDPSESVVTLDLGGGSVQVTFLPRKISRIQKDTPDHLHPVSILNKNVDTYSYSYLGLGLMTARLQVLLQENAENDTEFYSSCVNSAVKNASWKYGGKTYSVSGRNDSIEKFDFKKCYDLVRTIVVESNVDKPPEIFDHKIVAFSYFFDRAAEVGIVDPNDGGIVTVTNFKKEAKRSCERANAQNPFICLDLTFITSLFSDGFGLHDDTPITLSDTIDGHEISWALGAAYQILEEKS